MDNIHIQISCFSGSVVYLSDGHLDQVINLIILIGGIMCFDTSELNSSFLL